METFRVRIEQVLLPPNVSAGMNPFVLMKFAYELRASNEDPDPIVVELWDDCNLNLYNLVDGRHRFIAAVLAGRPDVLCVLKNTE